LGFHNKWAWNVNFNVDLSSSICKIEALATLGEFDLDDLFGSDRVKYILGTGDRWDAGDAGSDVTDLVLEEIG
jgi:hypothetical protein